MKSVDLNVDVGESLPGKQIGDDEGILPLVSSTNIACGFHGGNPDIMRETIELAIKNQVAVGAHPSFNDIEGFGRREMLLHPQQVFDLVLYQVSAMKGFTDQLGVPLHHVKPHGALYNLAAKRVDYADAIAAAIHQVSPTSLLYGLAGSELIQAAAKAGLGSCSEVFADRAYLPGGMLAPRTMPGAVIHDVEQAVHQVLAMVRDQRVRSISGEWVRIKADTICIHGDHPGAVIFAGQLRNVLEAEGFQINAP